MATYIVLEYKRTNEDQPYGTQEDNSGQQTYRFEHLHGDINACQDSIEE